VADSSAVGAALLAAVASGRMSNLAEAAGAVSAIADTIAPDRANRAAYHDAYARYRRLFESLKPMY
jgi:sugar (pentulose or hexulose) kinase